MSRAKHQINRKVRDLLCDRCLALRERQGNHIEWDDLCDRCQAKFVRHLKEADAAVDALETEIADDQE